MTSFDVQRSLRYLWDQPGLLIGLEASRILKIGRVFIA